METAPRLPFDCPPSFEFSSDEDEKKYSLLSSAETQKNEFEDANAFFYGVPSLSADFSSAQDLESLDSQATVPIDFDVPPSGSQEFSSQDTLTRDPDQCSHASVDSNPQKLEGEVDSPADRLLRELEASFLEKRMVPHNGVGTQNSKCASPSIRTCLKQKKRKRKLKVTFVFDQSVPKKRKKI